MLKWTWTFESDCSLLFQE